MATSSSTAKPSVGSVAPPKKPAAAASAPLPPPRAGSVPRRSASTAGRAASSSENVSQAAAASAAAPPAVEFQRPADRAEAAKWHGYRLADEMLPLPRCIVQCEDKARPNYTDIKASEYEDSPDVLDRKADLLIEMFRNSRQRMIYSGAGISTSSGINDYASNAKGSAVQPSGKPRLTHDFISRLRPTPAHRILTSMERAGMVEFWLQQNHDGLAHKAGFPKAKINEVHGSWHDATNPVVKMSGNLRDDLFQWMLQWEDRADFCFALGTSFSGMNADRCATSCAKRHLDRGVGQGLAVLTIQQTPVDSVAGLRIFSKIDPFMEIVRRKLGLDVDSKTYAYPNSKIDAAAAAR